LELRRNNIGFILGFKIVSTSTAIVKRLETKNSPFTSTFTTSISFLTPSTLTNLVLAPTAIATSRVGTQLHDPFSSNNEADNGDECRWLEALGFEVGFDFAEDVGGVINGDGFEEDICGWIDVDLVRHLRI
jgi:hypothetical protein